MFLQFLLYSKVTQPPIHTHSFFFFLTQETRHSSLGCTAGSHQSSTLNTMVCTYQPPTPCHPPSLPPPPGKLKSSLHAHDLFLNNYHFYIEDNFNFYLLLILKRHDYDLWAVSHLPTGSHNPCFSFVSCSERRISFFFFSCLMNHSHTFSILVYVSNQGNISDTICQLFGTERHGISVSLSVYLSNLVIIL